jgi:hypothetical protein
MSRTIVRIAMFVKNNKKNISEQRKKTSPFPGRGIKDGKDA